jgi:4a-hydroxytetrahydrobiopterin dehydratase
MVLAEQKCRPCAGEDKPLDAERARGMAREIPLWTLAGNAIEREFRFKDFREAMAFVGKVADIANAEDHHPEISIAYSRVKLSLTTHKIGGLSANDFIFAAKVDRLPL